MKKIVDIVRGLWYIIDITKLNQFKKGLKDGDKKKFKDARRFGKIDC